MPSVDENAFATLTVCCDLDLWPPESNQVISGVGAGEYSQYVIPQDLSNVQMDGRTAPKT